MLSIENRRMDEYVPWHCDKNTFRQIHRHTYKQNTDSHMDRLSNRGSPILKIELIKYCRNDFKDHKCTSMIIKGTIFLKREYNISFENIDRRTDSTKNFIYYLPRKMPKPSFSTRRTSQYPEVFTTSNLSESMTSEARRMHREKRTSI